MQSVAQATIKWLDDLRFVGIDSTDHSVVLSGTDDIGMKPSDLVLVALGACSAYDVVSILTKKRQKLTGLEVQVTADADKDPPWTFRKFHVHYVVKGSDLSEKAVQDAIELSDTKYCSVAATLRGSAEVTHSYEIVQEQ
jgi:putative redox protein